MHWIRGVGLWRYPNITPIDPVVDTPGDVHSELRLKSLRLKSFYYFIKLNISSKFSEMRESQKSIFISNLPYPEMIVHNTSPIDPVVNTPEGLKKGWDAFLWERGSKDFSGDLCKRGREIEILILISFLVEKNINDWIFPDESMINTSGKSTPLLQNQLEVNRRRIWFRNRYPKTQTPRWGKLIS